jgi:SnoaL-like domain
VTPGELADAYLAALEAADEARVLALFTGDAIVHSPLYGPVRAAGFYPALFRDTSRASLRLHGVTSGTSPAGAPLVGLWFHFAWRLGDGRDAPFDVVDMLELSPDGQIASLHIIYDTVEVRPAFEASAGHPSWRPGGQS